MSAEMMNDIERFLKLAILAVTTKALYRHYLVELAIWMELEGFQPGEISDEDLIDFLTENQDWSDSTRHSAVAAAHKFYTWRFGPDHAVMRVKVKRGNPGPQRTLTVDQINQLLSSFDTMTAEGIRNVALVTLMLDTGLRNAEVCRLELSRLNLKRCHLDVIVKGGDWGEGVFSDYTASCLTAWLSVRQRVASSAVKTVFVSIRGTKPGTELTPPGMRGIFREFGDKAGLGLISPHDLRRSFATIATEEGGAPTRTLQKAGRWADIGMVERYTQRLSNRAMKKYFPVSIVMDRDKSDGD